ncbi:hypothetical protein CPC08DRAFT_704545 [Agrocybe pediades]|nr:hypothetical protein CPC08DRAFT_704545 [Agrocybe pediades]
MTEATFGRRTRSQLTLPDNILQIPDRSPMKDARNALRSQAAAGTNSRPSQKASDSTEDELLLSPGKPKSLTKSAVSSKRSASPPPEDEYNHRSSSPSDGRELKRVKRDTGSSRRNGMEKSSERDGVEEARTQTETLGYTKNVTEPKMPTGRRSARRRSNTTTKQTLSTVSASPPPTVFSPHPPVTPTKTRAQSVPVFPVSYADTGGVVPHIDLRNYQTSPKRSRSRSPSKESQLRMLSNKPLPPFKLPTIQDEPPFKTDESNNVTQEVETRIEAGTPTMPQSIVADTTANEQEPFIAPPTPLASSSKALHIQIPATPATESLDRLIPMSPLTPVLETPLPTRTMPTAGTWNRHQGFTGRKQSNLVPIEERESRMLQPAAPSDLRSRLPRPAAVPPTGVHAKLLQAAGKESSAAASSSKTSTTSNLQRKASGPKVNAFDLLMKGSQDARAKELVEKEKSAVQTSSKALPKQVAPIFKETPVAGPSTPKPKMKARMKRNTKPKPEQQPLYVGTSDNEEEEEEARRAENSSSRAFDESDVDKAELSHGQVASSTHETPMEVVEDSQDEETTAFHNGETTETVAGLSAEVNATHDAEDVQAEDPDVSMISAVANETSPENETSEEQREEATPQTAEAIMASPTAEAAQASIVASATIENEVVASEPIGEAAIASEIAQEVPSENVEERPPQESSERKAAAPKPKPFGKKKQPTAIPVASGGRVTRSASSQKNTVVGIASIAGPSHARPTISAAAKRAASVTAKKALPSVASGKAPVPQKKVPQGSPMKITSPTKAPTLKTPTKAVGRFTLPNNSISTPSPTKIARPSTSMSTKPSGAAVTRTFSMDTSQVSMGASSSLSTLSNALERLRMPTPSRPSTSMGFNRDVPDEDKEARSKDDADAATARGSIGLGLPSNGLKRATTLGPEAFKPAPSTTVASSSSKSATGKNMVQKPLSAFLFGRGGAKKPTASARGTAKTSVMGKPIFGIGGAPRRLASKKTGLPTVIGSPVKGGTGADNTMHEYAEDEGDEGKGDADDATDNFMAPQTAGGAPPNVLTGDALAEEGSSEGKGKGKETSSSRAFSGSRRVSMVSQALSQSLNAPPPVRGLMGPPATPPHKRSSSSTYPSTSAGGSSPSSGPTVGTRASARLAKTAPGGFGKIRGGTDGHVSSQRKGAAESAAVANPAVEALKEVLKDCVIFVDVKTDDGEEAGSLFVEMLEGVGARVLTRVGQTCTHIVFKNGLMSTISRYRLLRDPKPLVVGIAWVVDCVEQLKHIDEKDYLVDIEHTNVAGVNKRRRSIIPKMFASEIDTTSDAGKEEGEGDISMDGSTSSITMDDDLAPLERARRRKSLMPAHAKP